MLTDADCRNSTCPEGKPRLRLSDAGGLYLEVTPNGARRWFVKYRFLAARNGVLQWATTRA